MTRKPKRPAPEPEMGNFDPKTAMSVEENYPILKLSCGHRARFYRRDPHSWETKCLDCANKREFKRDYPDKNQGDLFK